MGSHSHGMGEVHVLPRPPAVVVRCGPDLHGPERDHHAPCSPLLSLRRALRSRKQVPLSRSESLKVEGSPGLYRHALASGRPQGPSGAW